MYYLRTKLLNLRRSVIHRGTVEPRFNEALYNEVLGITDDNYFQPGQSYRKMYGTCRTSIKRTNFPSPLTLR